MPIALPVATLIAGAVAGGATAYGAHEASKSAKHAADVQGQTDQATLEEARQRDAEAKRQFDAQQALEKQKFDAEEEQRLHDRALADAAEARRAPYRAASQAALARLGDMLGLHFDTTAPTTGGALGGVPASQPGTGPAPMPQRIDPGGINDPYGPYSHDFSPRNPDGSLATGPLVPVPSNAYQYDASQPSYSPVNPMTTAQLLKLRPYGGMA